MATTTATLSLSNFQHSISRNFSSCSKKPPHQEITTDCNAPCEDEDKNEDMFDDDEDDTGSIIQDNDAPNEVVKITEPATIYVCKETLPCLSDFDVLIRTEAIAISGSDIHVFETGSKANPNLTLGHDATGVIEKVGRSIQYFKPGDRVAIESGLSCGICDYCKQGKYNMCTQLIFNGFFAKYQIHPADLCHKLPTSVTMEEGTLAQTLAMGCQACYKARIDPKTNVLVMGSGPTAVAAALCARAIGARHVCMACTMESNLASVARSFKINYIVADPSISCCDVLNCIRKECGGWPHVVINCAVSDQSMNLAITALHPCGTLVVAECDSELACFNALDVLMKDLRIVASFRFTNMFPVALELMRTGKAPMGELIARSYYWNQVAQAFQSAQNEANCGNKKVIVKCRNEDQSSKTKKT